MGDKPGPLFYPADAILAEEAFEQKKAAWTAPASFWTVDALDGTASFVDGFEGFCIQAAYIVDGAPVLGVIHEPVRQMTYWAIRGAGAYRRTAGTTTIAKSSMSRSIMVSIAGLPPCNWYLRTAGMMSYLPVGRPINSNRPSGPMTTVWLSQARSAEMMTLIPSAMAAPSLSVTLPRTR